MFIQFVFVYQYFDTLSASSDLYSLMWSRGKSSDLPIIPTSLTKSRFQLIRQRIFDNLQYFRRLIKQLDRYLILTRKPMT